MLALTFHADLITAVAEGDNCCETILNLIETCECEVIDWVHHGVSCSVRLLSSYSQTYDRSDTTRSGEL